MIVQHTTALNFGGTENNAVTLLKAFSAMGIPTALIVDRPPYEELDEIRSLGLDVRTLDTSAKTTPSEFRKKLRSELVSLGATLIHSHIWERQIESHIEPAALGIKTVTTVHTTLRGNLRHRLGITRDPIRFEAFRRALRLTNPVTINISDTSQSGFRRLLPTVTRSRRVYCGVPIPEVAADPGTGGDAPTVLWVGSMIERKRPLLALAVWGKIAQSFPRARLRMIGTGPQMDRVQQTASSIPGVEIAGPLKPWADEAERSHIYFHTGVHEGVPTTVLEAMASGLPIVATSSGATREAVEEGLNGLLVGEDDRTTMVCALGKTISDPLLRKRLGAAGRERAKSTFSLPMHVSSILGVYQELAGLEMATASGSCKR